MVHIPVLFRYNRYQVIYLMVDLLSPLVHQDQISSKWINLREDPWYYWCFGTLAILIRPWVAGGITHYWLGVSTFNMSVPRLSWPLFLRVPSLIPRMIYYCHLSSLTFPSNMGPQIWPPWRENELGNSHMTGTRWWIPFKHVWAFVLSKIMTRSVGSVNFTLYYG